MENIAITLPQKLWDKVVAGEKVVELRKRFPRRFDSELSRCYVVGKGTSMVLGALSLSFEQVENTDENRRLVQKGAGVPLAWIERYYAGHLYMHLWYIIHFGDFRDWDVDISVLGLARVPESFVYL